MSIHCCKTYRITVICILCVFYIIWKLFYITFIRHTLVFRRWFDVWCLLFYGFICTELTPSLLLVIYHFTFFFFPQGMEWSDLISKEKKRIYCVRSYFSCGSLELLPIKVFFFSVCNCKGRHVHTKIICYSK